MTLADRCLAFLAAYARKDLPTVAAMLAPEVLVSDWNLSVHGHAAAVAFMQGNFEAARSLAIEVLHLHPHGDTVVAEVRIVVDGHITLRVADVMQFDAEGRIVALRSYKGGDAAAAPGAL